MSKNSKIVYFHTAVIADEPTDSYNLKNAIAEMIIEGASDHGRNGLWGGVDFISTDQDKNMVVNEVEGRMKDGTVDADAHLIMVSVSIDIKYL